MKVVLQRVTSASVTIDGKLHAQIGVGMLILLGIETEDLLEDAEWLVNKIIGLRIFNDDDDKMNLSIKDVSGTFLVISQFTLYASTKKGYRPSYIRAARPETAIPLYEYFKNKLGAVSELTVHSGIFGEDMKVSLVNDGPVTIIIDSKNKE
jgi:D-tyrosyl-tRNA(Tyr) deacylase